MLSESKAERLALYEALRQERYGPLGRLRRERRNPQRLIDEDAAVLARRLRDLTEATDDGEA